MKWTIISLYESEVLGSNPSEGTSGSSTLSEGTMKKPIDDVIDLFLTLFYAFAIGFSTRGLYYSLDIGFVTGFTDRIKFGVVCWVLCIIASVYYLYGSIKPIIKSLKVLHNMKNKF